MALQGTTLPSQNYRLGPCPTAKSRNQALSKFVNGKMLEKEVRLHLQEQKPRCTLSCCKPAAQHPLCNRW